MIVELGYFCLVLAFSLAGYAQISGLLGIYQNSANLIRSSLYSSILLFFCVLASYLSLTYAFVVSDFYALCSKKILALIYQYFIKSQLSAKGMDRLSFALILVMLALFQLKRE